MATSVFDRLCAAHNEDRRVRPYPEPTKPGMYLRLFHGRNSPDEQLDDWGFEGPEIGPLQYAHTTYASDVKLEFLDVEDHDKFFLREVCGYNRNTEEVSFSEFAELDIAHGMVVYDGKYYGDWSVFYFDGGK